MTTNTPAALEKTLETRKQLWKSVEGMDDETLNRRSQQGGWTIAQVLEHLYLMEGAISSSLTQALRAEGDHPTDRKPFHLSLDRSRKIEAPEYLRPAEEFRTRLELEAKLERSRDALVLAAGSVDEERLPFKSYPHPVFGLMDAAQWLEFVGVHEQRHMDQIEEIKRAL
ncbi:DinB family protein [Saccharibacillus sp. CPCC 101409]|uniref:DinB family protein n=1 Tax=Saccharibacillus sp. CPCC 101409 TaxID=3058041 RepID=UPI0026735092|nr:DinB family protein [Saccharibacillus sp. CPCC 101409]MDO3408261.1 DinB family protein [Saccharibacillus sp. CPCC 101409]